MKNGNVVPVRAYNVAQVGEARKICNFLRKEINQAPRGAENKVWHGHPVWFLDGNPIVAFAKLKDRV